MRDGDDEKVYHHAEEHTDYKKVVGVDNDRGSTDQNWKIKIWDKITINSVKH